MTSPSAGRPRPCRARSRRRTTTPAGQGVGLQRHLHQRHRQQLPLRRGRPGDHRRHAGHQRGRRRVRHGLDHTPDSGSSTPSKWPPPGPTRSASGWPRRTAITDALHIANSSGTNLTGAVAVPNTGGYQTWTTVTASVTLPAGQQTLTVDQDSNGWNFHYLAFTQGSGGGGGGGGGGTGPTEYCGTQDLALDQPTTASSTQDATDYPAPDATDGNPGTRWSSAASDPQWLDVDLGSQQQICSVGILWEAAYATAFQIQVSNDNSTWTTVYSTTTGTGGNQTFTVSATARYIRMYGTARATQFGDSIFEFDVYGLTTTPPVTGGNGNGGNGVCPWVGSTAPVAQRVQQVLNTMDQSEEVTLLSGDGGSSYIGQVNGIPNLCIKPLNMEDGPSGVGDGNGGVTAFPDGESAAATWDPTLIQQEGAAMGAEFAGKGVNVSLGPTTNLVRDPRWGRTYETYGEDPYLAGQITSAEVRGPAEPGRDGRWSSTSPPTTRSSTRTAATTRRSASRRWRSCTWRRSRPPSSSRRRRRSCAPTPWSTAPPPARTPTCCRTDSTSRPNSGGFVTSDWGAAGNAVADARGRHGHRDAVLRLRATCPPPSRPAR